MSSVSEYLRSVERELVAGNATEHTHRRALQDLIESLERGLAATNEPRRVECGAPDLLVSRDGVTVGYVEAKDVRRSLDEAERSGQLKRYREALGNLILTDYLEFRWYVDGDHRERARLGAATSEGRIRRSRPGAQAVADLFGKFLAQQPPAIGQPSELAQRMASLARMIRDLIRETFQREAEQGRLHAQLKAFRETLIPDLAPDQFADMYAQTITYGLFAARVRADDGHSFTRRTSAWRLPKTNPFLRKLFNEIAGPDLDPRIAWLVDDLAQLLARADMAEILQDFGKRTRQEDPVVHFYETFLAAYDPRMRQRRGVYYTPEPVVSYIVRSLDHILKTRFDRSMGLADAHTLILDPAAGTGTFLYFVIQRIRETLLEKGQAGAWNDYVEKHLLPRIFGFELLMVPYTVAHMKLGILLQETGYDFASGQRLGIYLTNTLEEAITQAQTLGFAGFISEEANAAAEIKREKPIMVVLGNPPYSVSSANRGKWITAQIEEYKEGLAEKKISLDDDYIKFIRFAQWRIERTGGGVIGLISNNSYLSGLTHRRMRQSLLKAFDVIRILNLHGDARIGERSPDGSADENVFDIMQGVTIALFAKNGAKDGEHAQVLYGDMFGPREHKYEILLSSSVRDTEWQRLQPTAPYFFFVPKDFDGLTEYNEGWKATDILRVHGNGVKTDRDAFCFDFERGSLADRVRLFFGKDYGDGFRERYRLYPSSSYDIEARRDRAAFSEQNIARCLYRPFDRRWLYYQPGFTSRPARKVMRHMRAGNVGLLSCRQQADVGFRHVFCSNGLAECCAVSLKTREITSVFPLYLYTAPAGDKGAFFGVTKPTREPNLSPAFIAAVEESLGLNFVPDGAGDLASTFGPEDVFHYIYAVLHSPTYRQRYAEFLKIDFPRVPLTADLGLFRALCALGEELVALHLMESPQLNEPITSFPIRDSNVVERVRYAEPRRDEDGNVVPGRVYINKTQYFEGVPPEVWQFHVGGYQVCHKWLKDRRRRQLCYDDVQHYQKIVVALKGTIRLMDEIDEAIQSQGGWPLA